eukprot:scaffold38317_cov58-Phaeocystis_antarctica.AAC.1
MRQRSARCLAPTNQKGTTQPYAQAEPRRNSQYVREKLCSVRRDNATRAAGAGVLTPALLPRSRRRSRASSLHTARALGSMEAPG